MNIITRCSLIGTDLNLFCYYISRIMVIYIIIVGVHCLRDRITARCGIYFLTFHQTIIKTSIIGIIGNVLLVAGKIVVGFLASSVSLIADAVNNLTDALSSIVTVVGAKLSVKKPDRKHPFGHGRIEFVASAAIGALIFVAGAMAIYESIVGLVNHDEPTYATYSFILIAVAVLVKVGLGVFYRYKGKKVHSDALKASGVDALWDSVLSFGTLIGAIVSHFTGVHLEGYIGIVIGLLIIKSAVDVLREAISKIIGERTESDFTEDLLADVAKVEGVKGVYDLILHNYGADRYIGSLHVEVADDTTAKEMQKLEREIAFVCYEKYHTIMTVGVYAENAETEYALSVKNTIENVVKDYPDILQTHGFFVDEENKVIGFDVIIRFECENPDDIYESLLKKVSGLFPDNQVYIILDKDYSLT